MKYLLSLFGLGLLIFAGFWFLQSNSKTMNMDHLMTRENDINENLSVLKDHNVPEVKPTEVVELKDGDTYDLEATIVSQKVGNRLVKRLAYNGQIPGPVLKMQKGAKITVNFINHLDMETSLHSHGLRGNYLMDGAVPITPAILVGESFSYELEFPDTGVFWYHPHVREDYQQEMGLYGNMIVEEAGYWNKVDLEAYLIVDDILEGGDFSSIVVTNTLMGRFGNKLLINDKEDYNLTVKAGEITRAYITNVANTRTFQLEFKGALSKLVGGDMGRIEKEKMIASQIIAPAERYVVELYYEQPGTYPIVHRGKTIGTVTVESSTTNHKSEFMTLRNNSSEYTDIRANFSKLITQEPDKKLRLNIAMKGEMGNMMNGNNNNMMSGGNDMMREHCKMMPEMSGCESYRSEETSNATSHNDEGIEWEDDMSMMNNMSTNENIEWLIEDQNTGKKNGEIDWTFKQGDLVKIRIYNDEKSVHPMQHPIHFHGQRFVVLATDGVVSDNLQWKDTVLIPKGKTIDVLVDMSNPGIWMAHCHIAEHLHSGMMFGFKVN